MSDASPPLGVKIIRPFFYLSKIKRNNFGHLGKKKIIHL